jgi:subtilisin family serine protease
MAKSSRSAPRRSKAKKTASPAILRIPAKPRSTPMSTSREPFVAGKIHVRFKSGGAQLPVKRGMARAALNRDAEASSGPMQYLRDNCGLSDMTQTFAAATGAERGPRGLASAVRTTRKATVARPKLSGFTTLTLDPKSVTTQLLKRLKSDPDIDVAERVPNRWLLAKTPKAGGDPQLNLQWGLMAINWNLVKRPDASGVHVAVIDSGIDMNHPDLAGAIESYSHVGNSARDFIGHGSHVAGIIAAVANNGQGIAGVSNARIHAFKMFDDPKGGSKEAPYNDENYMSALAAALESPQISMINLSLGGTEPSETEAAVMKELIAAGKLVVAAMGNEFDEGNADNYPAAYPDVLAVGAIDDALRQASFSNTGKHIGLVAPGVAILSTIPLQDFPPKRKETEYDSWPGTSMATPHVVGAAALLKAKFPTRTGKWLKKRLLTRARRVPAMGNKAFTQVYGRGLVDVAKAL